ncbi:MAG: (2Fe-2S)-binding protein [Acidobacteria bacterium]|nr:(2Fe-2S)-binding protein [Acidobacteriota bacterium]
MANEETVNNEGYGLNRRNFLKNAGVAVAGGALAAGLTPPAERALAAESAIPSALTSFRCPICAKDFDTFAALKNHSASEHPGRVPPVTTTLNVNGKDYEVLIEPHWTLQRVLQFRLGLTGAKQMCGRGVCGSCTVIIDGRAVLSCTTLAVECEGKAIETVEGIAANPKWKALINSYCKWDAMQCGYCTPGFVVSAKVLLEKNPNPTEDQCREALAGNICCCGTYPRHPTAIMEAAKAINAST